MPLGLLTVATVIARASAEDSGLPTAAEANRPTLQNLAKSKQNPFAQTLSLPIQAVTGFGIGPRHDVGEQLTAQPSIPVPLGADWNLIARTLLPVTFSPDPNKRFGLGDAQPSLFLTPTRVTKWIWGVGPALQLPTATSNELGTGKWSAGPTGALIYSDGPWFAGVLGSQLWSVAGAHRTAVNLSTMEVLVSYDTESGWYIQSDPTFTYDWSATSADAWTVPLGFDLGKVTTINGQDVSFQIGGYTALKRPAGAPQWIIRAQLTFLFPR